MLEILSPRAQNFTNLYFFPHLFRAPLLLPPHHLFCLLLFLMYNMYTGNYSSNSLIVLIFYNALRADNIIFFRERTFETFILLILLLFLLLLLHFVFFFWKKERRNSPTLMFIKIYFKTKRSSVYSN